MFWSGTKLEVSPDTKCTSTFGLSKKVYLTSPKYFGTCRRTRHQESVLSKSKETSNVFVVSSCIFDSDVEIRMSNVHIRNDKFCQRKKPKPLKDLRLLIINMLLTT